MDLTITIRLAVSSVLARAPIGEEADLLAAVHVRAPGTTLEQMRTAVGRYVQFVNGRYRWRPIPGVI